jgi:hypothetical protein
MPAGIFQINDVISCISRPKKFIDKSIGIVVLYFLPQPVDKIQAAFKSKNKSKTNEMSFLRESSRSSA